MENPNKSSIGDILQPLTKAGLSFIPGIGPIAAEIFGLVVLPPLEKRRVNWMNEIAEKLKQLEEASRIDINQLSKNEEFIDVIVNATSLALKTSEELKIQALKNAVINIALNQTTDSTKNQIFLNLVDRFTVWHITILSFFHDPKKWFENKGRTPTKMLAGSLASILLEAYPELRGQDELVDLIWNDLANAGLHSTSSLKAMMTSDGTLVSRTSKLGKEFLQFITEK